MTGVFDVIGVTAMKTSSLLICVLLSARSPPIRMKSQDARRSSAGAPRAGTDGNGGELGPNIATRVPLRTDQDLTTVNRQGLVAAGMPAFANLSDTESTDLVRFLRALRPRAGSGPERGKATLTGGRVLEGLVLNQSATDMQMLGDDRKIHLLRKNGTQYRSVTSQTDWPSYHGQSNGTRYSTLAQINRANAARLTPKSNLSLPNTSALQVTPVVVEGVMYVTSANECYALDAGSGRQIWHYQRARTKGLIGVSAGGANRGVAVAGERVFMVTDHAHLVAGWIASLALSSGKRRWPTGNRTTTRRALLSSSAMLVIPGIAGGDDGVRGFLAPYDQTTGKEVWRFWTVPKRGEPGSESWQGKAIDHPGATTWMTGAYDAQLDTLYSPVGNPGPDLIGDVSARRQPVLGLHRRARSEDGKVEVAFSVHAARCVGLRRDAAVGARRYLLARPAPQAARAGESQRLLLRARPDQRQVPAREAVVKTVTWASGLTSEGRPIVVPGMEPTREGKRVCPSLEGASNWCSTSFNPITGLY